MLGRLLLWRGMKSTNPPSTNSNINPNSRESSSNPAPAITPKKSKWGEAPAIPEGIRTIGREYVNPVDYEHPFESMAEFAKFLSLRYDANRTRHAYYRHIRLIHEHLGCDPATITEAQLRDYFLLVKLKKHWKPKTIRQAAAAARMFFMDSLGHTDWTVLSQIRTKDHDTLPAVLSRPQVRDLLEHTFIAWFLGRDIWERTWREPPSAMRRSSP